jgi:hypothetical protein
MLEPPPIMFPVAPPIMPLIILEGAPPIMPTPDPIIPGKAGARVGGRAGKAGAGVSGTAVRQQLATLVLKLSHSSGSRPTILSKP